MVRFEDKPAKTTLPSSPGPRFEDERAGIRDGSFASLGIPFERVDTDPGLTMEDCQHIDAKIRTADLLDKYWRASGHELKVL